MHEKAKAKPKTLTAAAALFSLDAVFLRILAFSPPQSKM
jgi:hypothetical protein